MSEQHKPTSSDAGDPLNAFDDVPFSISVEVGRADMKVSQLVGLHEGAILALDRGIGDPVDLTANGFRLAAGEIIAQGDSLCFRVSRILKPGDQTGLEYVE